MRAYLNNSIFNLALEDARFRQALMAEGIFILPLKTAGQSKGFTVGDITVIDGMKFRVIKIHERGIAFRRVRWYDVWMDRLFGKGPVEW